MRNTWWVHLVGNVLFVVIMGLVASWIAKSRARPRPESEAGKLYQPASILVIGLIGFLFFAGLAVISNIFRNNTTSLITTLIFVAFSLPSLWLIAEYIFARHEISEQGLNFGTSFGRRDFVAWSEITSVRYAPTMKWFKLRSSSGQVARISATLIGLQEFAIAVLYHVDRSAIEPAALKVLESSAVGDLPSIWGGV